MRITHILFSGLGGVFSVVNSLVKFKNKDKKFSLIYVGPEISDDAIKHKKKFKDKFFFIKTLKFLSFFFFPFVFKSLMKLKPEIIVLHNYQIIASLLAKFFLKSKLVYVNHYSISNKNFKDELIIKLFGNFIDKFVVLNNDNYQFLLKKKKIPKNKIAKIYNGIYINPKFEKNKKFKNKVFTVGMAGRINMSKNFDLLINSVQSIIEKKIEIKCLIAGKGEEEKNLKKLILKKNRKKIIFCGYLNQIKLNSWFNKIDLYIQATKSEAMSISIFQAMSMKIPVMASYVKGIRNLKYPSLKDNMLFSNNLNDLEKKIIRFKELDQKHKNAIAKKQFKYVLNNYSEIKMIKKYDNLYKSLI